MSNEFWDLNASAWSEVISSQGIPSRKATNQALMEIILALKTKSLLDIGCGEGFLLPALQEKSIYYQGVDGSEKLTELALQKHGNFFENVTYQKIIESQWRPSQKFNVVLFNFSLFDEKISDLLKAAKSFLHPQGSILIQTLHPCFAMKEYVSGWNLEDFKTMSVPFSGTMRWYGRTLSDWQKEFREAGLSIQEIQEPRFDGKVASIIFRLI